ncbi:MAG: glycerate kinase, partial [Rhodospirillales bacterium]|nr:glycerate kinase [Rhodospirillales bacterium]
ELLLSGGEVTVTLGEAGGKGGPNAEYALALAIALDGCADIHAIACDTDGIDGDGDAAGALISPHTLTRAAAAGMDPRAMLDRHDSYGFFNKLGDHVITGPTRTNVNDFRAVLIGTGGSDRIDL